MTPGNRSPFCRKCGVGWSTRTPGCATCTSRHKQRLLAMGFSPIAREYNLQLRTPVTVRATWDVVA